MAERRGWPVARYVRRRRRERLCGQAPSRSTAGCSTTSAPGSSTPSSSGTSTGSTGSPRELEEFFDICKAAGVSAMASVTGDTDLSTHDGQFLARILGAVARKESDDKSRRITRKHQEMAQAGRLLRTGTRPFGYRDDFRTVEPIEAAAIREAAARVLAGDSLRGVATDWNARGITERPGRRLVGPGPAPDAPLRPDLRAALLPRRDRGERGLGADHHARRDRPPPGDPDRPGAPDAGGPSVDTCSRAASCAAGAARPSSSPDRAPTARAATSAPRARACPAAGGSRSWPSRSKRSSRRPSCTASTRPRWRPP